VGTGLWFVFFRAMQGIASAQIPASRYYILPSNVFWLLPAMFLGLPSSIVPVPICMGALLGKRYDEYIHHSDLKFGMDGWKVLCWLVGPVLAACLGVVPLALDSYTRFTDESMFVNPFWSFGEREYPYSEVAEVRAVDGFIAPIGNRVQRPHFEIAFR